jgi:hypothetical protein
MVTEWLLCMNQLILTVLVVINKLICIENFISISDLLTDNSNEFSSTETTLKEVESKHLTPNANKSTLTIHSTQRVSIN